MNTYPIELDVRLSFDPPMSDGGAAIVVSRRIELPFVPYNGVQIYCRAWDDCPEPIGLALKDVTWDMDRQLFLAVAHHGYSDFPIATIPDEVRTWVARGWRLGSWMDWYERREATAGPADERASPDTWLIDGDEPDFERMHLLPPERRPAVFNRFWKALIRQMIESYADRPTAYAMDKSGTWRPDDGDSNGSLRRAWTQHTEDFNRLSVDEQIAWEDRVRKYPSLEGVLKTKATRDGNPKPGGSLAPSPKSRPI
jgi:hypothetical protein